MYSPIVFVWQAITFVLTTIAIILTLIHYSTILSTSTILTFIGISYFVWFVATTPICVAGICFGVVYFVIFNLIMRGTR